ncbi:MAG: hypothetical protein M3347_07475 [Armatimonadota bacterium]|nr:hypothetical protein [Armatimonadota bacterium]
MKSEAHNQQANQQRAYYMLKKIHGRCGEHAVASCVLGLPQEEDHFTLQEWDDTYKYLCNMGWIRALGANYASALTPEGIKIVHELPAEVPPPSKTTPQKRPAWKFWGG